MTETTPDAAVQIVADTLAGLGYGPDPPYDFHAVLNALARADMLCPPGTLARLAALEATLRVLDPVHQPYRKRGGRMQRCVTCGTGWPCRSRAALDAAAAGTTADERPYPPMSPEQVAKVRHPHPHGPPDDPDKLRAKLAALRAAMNTAAGENT